MCGSSSAGRSRRAAVRRSRYRAPSSVARPRWPVRSGGRKSGTACSSTITRTGRIGRPGPRARGARLGLATPRHKDAALAGLERWKSKHAEAAGFLAADDVLVDSMRGRSSTWTRIRVNLRHVPETLRPPQETPDPDDDPTREWRALRAKNKTRAE